MENNKTQINIPKEWSVLKVDDVFDFLRTCSHSKDQMLYEYKENKNLVHNVHYGDIHVRYSGYVDCANMKVPVLKNKTEVIPKDKYLKNGDLVMVDASEDYEGVGTSVELKNVGEYKFIAGLHTFALRSKNGDIAKGYNGLLFKNKNVHKRLKCVSTYSKVFGVSKTSLSAINIYLPPLPEQKRIVEVLETWDKVILKLAEKIKIKKNIKKGLMQKLLTGKVRLPGFNGEWQKLVLDEICEVVKNGVPKYSGLKKYYSTRAIKELDKVVSLEYSKRPSRADMLPLINDLGLAKMKGTNRCFIVKEGLVDCIFSTGFMFLKMKKKFDHRFVFYIISSDKFQYYKDLYSSSGIMGGIGNKDLLQIVINIPTIKEQEAIASILTIADQEIDLIKNKIDKFNAQKKYLLNNLVTGKIRVPVFSK